MYFKILAGEEKLKLLAKYTGPYYVLAANSDTLKVDENCVPSMISIDRQTTVPGGESQGGWHEEEKFDDMATEEREDVNRQKPSNSKQNSE